MLHITVHLICVALRQKQDQDGEGERHRGPYLQVEMFRGGTLRVYSWNPYRHLSVLTQTFSLHLATIALSVTGLYVRDMLWKDIEQVLHHKGKLYMSP